MKDYWVRFGCFLTGHNYGLVRNCSEGSSKSVKKYLSAILIISIIWGLLGFAFFQRYLKAGIIGASIAGVVMIIIIIQIERQIILAQGKNLWGKAFRILIALVMAIIGSVITDQIIFKDDIEKNKISTIQNDVDRVLVSKSARLDNEIKNLEVLTVKKELERISLIKEVTMKPFLKTSSSTKRNFVLKGADNDSVVARTETSLSDIPNPKAALIPTIDKQILDIGKQKSEKENARITIRQDLENELKSKTGFLDELTILFAILSSSNIAAFVWGCLFAFFISLELFVLVCKLGDSENDYDKLIIHQMEIRMKVLEKLNVE